jgi:dipeptidyl aminopeptidase/acylaminoacyl peptidase
VLAAGLSAQGAEFLRHPDDPAKRIEYYLAKPEGNGPWPALIHVHGHQPGERPGAAVYVSNGRLRQMSTQGVVGVAVSQPGYGKSDGPPDFCGPRTQAAIRAVIAHLRRQRWVRADRVGLYGYSRGAIAAGMVAAQVPELAVVILGAGAYDLEDAHRRLNRSHPELDGLARNLEAEAGTSREAFRDRSALSVAGDFKAATLILHGERDDRCPVDQARKLASALERNGTPVRLAIFPEAGHGLPPRDREEEIGPFLKRWLTQRDP